MRITGGKWEGFKEGWAKAAWSKGHAHFFIRTGLDMAVASCRPSWRVYAGDLFRVGTWSLCAHCEAMHRRPTDDERDVCPSIIAAIEQAKHRP